MLPETNFIRTTDEHHIKAAREFWKICDKKGFIYKKNYKIKYCVGCELEKTESELVEGKCPIHPNQDIELIDEENYFFKFSAFQKPLLELYDKKPNFVVPPSRLKEIRSFVERGLEDFSISRLKEKMPWGIEVPDDKDQVFYVWFDALVNYISAIGWPDDMKKFNKWWIDSGGVVQYCGKDNLRQQAAMWQAMLMAAGLPPSKQIIIDGFITGEGGIKMSKSLGNTVDPYGVVNEYSADALRYYVSRELHPFEDSPFSMERFKEAYNANLVNGLGNLLSRIMKMATTNDIKLEQYTKTTPADFNEKINMFDLKSAMDLLWLNITYLDGYIQENEPFKKIKSDPERAKKDILFLLNDLKSLGENLAPFLPSTSKIIIDCVNNNKMPETPLFPRKE